MQRAPRAIYFRFSCVILLRCVCMMNHCGENKCTIYAYNVHHVTMNASANVSVHGKLACYIASSGDIEHHLDVHVKILMYLLVNSPCTYTSSINIASERVKYHNSLSVERILFFLSSTTCENIAVTIFFLLFLVT